VVSDGTRIAMGTTLEQGLELLLDPRRSLPAVVQPLQAADTGDSPL
jgi:hypothetical protein